MKVNRVIHTYAVKITDEPFTLFKWKNFRIYCKNNL